MFGLAASFQEAVPPVRGKWLSGRLSFDQP